MSTFSDYLENAILDYVFRNTGAPTSTTVYLSLHTTPGPTDAGSANEITGVGNYARQPITFGAAAAGAISNTAAVSFGPVTGANFGDIVAIGIWDAVTGGNMVAWDGITTATVNIGDTLNFAIGAINITLD